MSLAYRISTEPGAQVDLLKNCPLHSQVPLRQLSGLQSQPGACCSSQAAAAAGGNAPLHTPLPIWCMKLPCPSHERELKAQVAQDAHRNSHLNFDFRLGKVQLV